MSRSSKYPSDRECISILKDEGCTKRVIIHCATVRAVAEEIAGHIPEADMDLVIAGALLHDIGRSQTHTIMHAVVGAHIAAARGLPDEIVEIVRRHTGAGLDREDVAELGLPPGNYIPETIEQKIVAHADNLVSDNMIVPVAHSVEKLERKGAHRGAQRIVALHDELSRMYGEDLDCMADVLGEMPKLKEVKP